MSNKAAKGSQFEREICGKLSLWWTEGASDSIFWRTSNSGGRATVRGKKGKRTHGQSGDICATDPIGDPFIRAITVECKRGYGKASIADLLDYKPHAALQEYEKWIAQAIESHKNAGSLSWMLITRRDQREALCFFPDDLVFRTDMNTQSIWPYLTMDFKLRGGVKKPKQLIIAMTFSEWLKVVTPAAIRAMTEEQ